MRKEKEQTIKRVKFKVTQLGFADGMELLTSLGKIIGPALSDSNKSVQSKIGDILAKISFQELSQFVEKLAKSTRIEREPGRWPVLEPEVDLAGNYDLTLRWLYFALEVNYGDFLAEGGLLHELTASAALTPT
ncbi:MAG: hypothetical protein KC505_11135 [Myxococcales bacterium]|nr:hypothetical protein [Myxococcales bacterium]